MFYPGISIAHKIEAHLRKKLFPPPNAPPINVSVAGVWNHNF
jgi:hypothetical protein